MKTSKQITPIGAMSNLIGMFVIIPDGNGSVAQTGKVIGKADEYYIVQWYVALTGEGVGAQLFRVSDMIDWIICPTVEDLNIIMDDFYKNLDRKWENPLRWKNYKKPNNENKL